MSKTFEIRNGRILTEKEYIAYLEGMAEGIWRTGVEISDGDYYSKSYDPLYLEMSEKIAHSYVFDFADGGRHHDFETLEGVYKSLLEEIQRIKKESKG